MDIHECAISCMRTGFDGRNDLLIGTDSFLGNIHEDNAVNIRVTGDLEGE